MQETRPPACRRSRPDVVDKVVALTKTEPPGETTHRTASAVAKAIGISFSSVQQIWKTDGLAPHRFQRFKLSDDPLFAAKLRDIVRIYIDPPAHALVLSLHEKS